MLYVEQGRVITNAIQILFKDLGTDTTTAIRMFLTQAVATNGFPSVNLLLSFFHEAIFRFQIVH